jgi:adenosylcobinamide-phosphate synthase
MAAGAGAMQVKLGGTASYHGQYKQRPTLGIGKSANQNHILSAINLVKRSIGLWCVLIMIGTIIRNVYFA